MKDYKISQCLNNIQKYEKWGNLLSGQNWVHLFNSNAPVSMSAIHNGLECVKAKMKLSVLQDNKHTDEEKRKSPETNRHRDSSNRRNNEE